MLTTASSRPSRDRRPKPALAADVGGLSAAPARGCDLRRRRRLVCRGRPAALRQRMGQRKPGDQERGSRRGQARCARGPNGSWNCHASASRRISKAAERRQEMARLGHAMARSSWCRQEIRRVCGLAHRLEINPALPPHQPDDADAGRDRRQPGDPQHVLGHRLHLRRRAAWQAAESRHRPGPRSPGPDRSRRGSRLTATIAPGVRGRWRRPPVRRRSAAGGAGSCRAAPCLRRCGRSGRTPNSATSTMVVPLPVERLRIGVHRAVELEEVGVALEGGGKDRAALGFALTAQDLRFLARLRRRSRPPRGRRVARMRCAASRPRARSLSASARRSAFMRS